ncbi:MAG: hypothetical protein WD696_19885 [Bryobacteraceae bacterium]
MNLILYDPLGRSLLLDAEDWRELLDAALHQGWQPAGTAQPPLPFDVDRTDPTPAKSWDRNYRSPQGQTVLRHDAKAMAAALRRAPQGWTDRFVYKAFIAFCEQGSFLLCEADKIPMGTQLVRLGEALEGAVRESEVAGTRDLQKSATQS